MSPFKAKNLLELGYQSHHQILLLTSCVPIKKHVQYIVYPVEALKLLNHDCLEAFFLFHSQSPKLIHH